MDRGSRVYPAYHFPHGHPTMSPSWPAVVFAAVTVVGCRRPLPADAPRTDVVARKSVEDVFLLTGELQAVHSEELTVPRVEGFRVQVKWLVEDGSEVGAGESVAELDNTQVAQSLEEKRLRVTEAQIALEGHEASLAGDASQKRFDLDKARTDAEKARIEAAVPVELRSRKEWNETQQALRKSESDLEKARLAVAVFEQSSRADVAVLRIARDKAARDLRAAEDSLRQLSLLAPKAGIAILGRAPNEDRPLQVGDTLWPGLRVVSLPDLETMEVVAFLPETDDGRVASGQAARVFLDSDLAHGFRGRIVEVSAVAQDARYAGGFKVRVSLEETSRAIMRPGLSARVEVVRSRLDRALLVPRGAVVRADGKTRVRRAGAGDLVDVRLGRCLALDCVVEDGLKEGERVVLP
jgi:multidrug resistance efflux pump